MRKRIVILIVLIIAFILGYGYINQSHRNIENEIVAFNLSSTDIESSFSKNGTEAETKYLNKTIEVHGTITEMNTKTITLDDKVFCQFLNPLEHGLNNDSQLKIKGRVIGYDDLLEQVKLDQCTIIKE
jgi:hypothetical protein